MRKHKSLTVTKSNSARQRSLGWHMEMLVLLFFVAISVLSMITTNPLIFRVLFVLAIVNCALKQSNGFNLLSVIPIVTILQLLLAPSELRDSMDVFVNYGPLSFAEYAKFARPLVFLGLAPFFLSDKCANGSREPAELSEEKIRTLIIFLVIFGFTSRFLLLWLGGVPILGALLFYGQLLWKVAIPVVYFHSSNRLLFFVLFGVLFLDCFSSTLWWDFVMIVVIAVLYGYSIGQVRMFKMIRFAVFGTAALVVIQSAKHLQRNDVELSQESVQQIFHQLKTANSEGIVLDGLLGRLNQGVHDSFVYNNETLKESKVSTIVHSFIAVFVPRYFYPEKPSFNTEKFVRLGGYEGMGSSFITLSGYAESYANFGLFGGMIFLFFYSMSLKRIWRTLKSDLNGPMLLLLVLPFFHAVRCEVDFFHWYSGLFNGWIVFAFVSRVLRNA